MPISQPASGSTADEPTLAQNAYLKLRKDIVDGVLEPGSKLRVEHLKDQYGVGAGTLREAIALLVADALVIQHGHRGFRVTAISLVDFMDITEMRAMLETEALRQSIQSGDDTWEGNLSSAFHMLSLAEERLKVCGVTAFPDWEERNRAFHEALIAACPSRWLHHFLAILYRQSERYRRLSIAHSTIKRDVHIEHEAIFQACLARDEKTATTLLAAHIRETVQAVRLMSEATSGASTVALTLPVTAAARRG
jgi:GntR family carbon starvation induced transcriptional regulator